MSNALYYGDNLEILRRHVADESVDLVYLDPPFKSNQDYNVLFAQHGERSAAQIKVFEDTWRWDQTAAAAYQLTVEQGGKVADAMLAFRTLLGTSDMLAYLSMMAPRVVELRRILKPTGSLYLHCDPAASHYLKLLLDAIFGPTLFRNEIIWKRTTAHSSAKRYGPIHDTILYYGKTGRVTWNEGRLEYTEEYLDRYYKYDDGDGRLYWRADLCAAGVRKGSSGQPWRGFDPAAKGMHWKFTVDRLDVLDASGRIYWPTGGTGWPQYKRYREELKGRAVPDMWDDVDRINPVGRERLGYPTQKPEALLERIIRASSNEGEIVLDPFCGCGTAIAVAQRLGRRWVGIDVTHLAVNLIRHRLQDAYGEKIAETYEVVGEPTTLDEAGELAKTDPYQFQWWALGLVGARPAQEKKGADRGIDGHLYFHEDDRGSKTHRMVISVKGGKPAATHVRDLLGVVERDRADMGVLITLKAPTRPMRRDAASAGFFESATGALYPRLQILTIAELLAGKPIDYPATGPGRRRAEVGPAEQLSFDAGHESDSHPPLAEPAEVQHPPASVPDLVDDLLRRARVARPPVRLEPILEELNMELSADPRLREDALLVPMTDPRHGPPQAWTVYYNPSKPETRRRFTIAHEVGHVLLHGKPVSAQARGADSRSKAREREVERFAAELLMPRRMMQAAVDEYGADVVSLSGLFQVSRAAVEIRLRELGLS